MTGKFFPNLIILVAIGEINLAYKIKFVHSGHLRHFHICGKIFKKNFISGMNCRCWQSIRNQCFRGIRIEYVVLRIAQYARRMTQYKVISGGFFHALIQNRDLENNV